MQEIYLIIALHFDVKFEKRGGSLGIQLKLDYDWCSSFRIP